ncbi:hypothetical protein ACJ5NV_20185 [Loktanella agnita]|uniref:hypothetical protein n=1 Tax=Loktanella agnita TaxID=287097 RepID=UPI003988D64A
MSIASLETTAIERRVLAHERILQALTAYIARTELQFIDHLRARFVVPMRMAQHENDHRETDDHAEEFIRAVMLLEEMRAPKPKEPEMTVKPPVSPNSSGGQGFPMYRIAQRDAIHVRERNGTWEARVDDKFCGNYHQKEHALAAAALHKLSPR